jgi:ABC-type phosphate transport system substrate-binding protein
MFHKLFTRRRGVALAAVAIGISGMTLSIAGTAGATNLNPPAVIAGSGSNTAYDLMTNLGTLFTQSPGCDLTAGSASPLTLQCLSGSYTVGGDGENGANAAAENPYNDVAFQYPAIGSGNGVEQLFTAGSTPINYARSSASPANSHGSVHQNYIEYAIDGVSWIHFTSVAGVKTDTSTLKNISETNLQAIYEGTLNCVVKGHSYTMNWICEGARKAAPIDCYVAQTGSGTEKTWAADIVGRADAAQCLNDESVGTAASHSGLFENEVSAMFTSGGTWNNGDEADAIYYFSAGKFKLDTGSDASGTLPGTPAKTTVAIGEIGGITPDQTTIQGTTGDGVPGDFPVIRYLSNVYNNT